MLNCNCGAQDRSEHNPHNTDCAVYQSVFDVSTKQGTEFIAKKDFEFKIRDGRRSVKVRAGDVFWQTNTRSATNGVYQIERRGSGRIGTGWYFGTEQMAEFFEIVKF